jgi:hypothetical protein
MHMEIKDRERSPASRKWVYKQLMHMEIKGRERINTWTNGLIQTPTSLDEPIQEWWSNEINSISKKQRRTKEASIIYVYILPQTKKNMYIYSVA